MCGQYPKSTFLVNTLCNGGELGANSISEPVSDFGAGWAFCVSTPLGLMMGTLLGLMLWRPTVLRYYSALYTNAVSLFNVTDLFYHCVSRCMSLAQNACPDACPSTKCVSLCMSLTQMHVPMHVPAKFYALKHKVTLKLQ